MGAAACIIPILVGIFTYVIVTAQINQHRQLGSDIARRFCRLFSSSSDDSAAEANSDEAKANKSDWRDWIWRV